MKKIAVVFILLVWSSLLIADSPKVGFLPKESFEFMARKSDLGINFDIRIKSIYEKLGQPRIASESINGIAFRKYSWDGLDLHVLPSKDTILIMTLTDGRFYTKDGISVGDDKTKVIRIYGQPGRMLESRIQYYYSTMDETWSMIFYLEKDKVISVRIHRLD